MNRCKEIENKVLIGASLSPEENQHLADCPECCRSAEFAARMEQLPRLEQEPAAYLDDLILQAAAARKHVWKPLVWKAVLPAAAAFALASGILFYQTTSTGYIQVHSASVAALEPSFDEQVFSLAMDVGSGMDTFSETMDIVI